MYAYNIPPCKEDTQLAPFILDPIRPHQFPLQGDKQGDKQLAQNICKGDKQFAQGDKQGDKQGDLISFPCKETNKKRYTKCVHMTFLLARRQVVGSE